MPLRERLDYNTADNRTAETYRAGLEKLREQYHHTIEIVSSGDIDRFNCFAFAVGIAELDEYQDIVSAKRTSAFLNSKFFRGLIVDGDLKPVDHAIAGGIAIYFGDGKLTHAAQVLDDLSRMRSKWGPLEVHEHALLEVPASYGDEILFFAPPDSTTIMKKLLNAM